MKLLFGVKSEQEYGCFFKLLCFLDQDAFLTLDVPS